MLPVIATVNGTAYSNSAKLATALVSNEKLDVEFFSVPFVPAVLQANATIKTNGFDLASLFTLAPTCEIVSNEDGVVKTYAPFAENRLAEEAFTVGGSAVSAVTNSIKYNTSGNLFYTFTPISLQKDGKYQPTWGSAGFRKGELVTNTDTGDVFYRESAIPFADGSMAEGYVVDAAGNVVGYKEADKGTNTFIRSNEYVNFYFTSTKLKYEAGKNEYIVVDFDFGTDDFIDEGIAVQVIPRVSGSGAWASDIYLKSLPIEPGTMAHVTLVFDYSTNNAHVFVNGVFAYTVAEGAMDGDHSGGRTDGSKWADKYLTGSEFTISEFKLGSDRKTGTVCFDNMAIRAYDLDASTDPIAAAVQAGDITTWSGSIYNDSYKITQFPAVASVDGENVGSLAALNAALAEDTADVKNVYIKHAFEGTVEVKTPATVETNGLAVDFDYSTGLYKFYHDDPFYVCTGTDYAYASSRLVLAHEDGSTVYNFTEITKDNCNLYAVPVVWFYSLDPEKVDVVFYVYGDEIAPLSNEAYIENGMLVSDKWLTLDMEELTPGDVVETFPVANNTLSETWYLLETVTEETDIAADIKQNAVVSSNITINVYVENSNTSGVEGETVVIDGVEYVKQEYTFAPADFATPIEVVFEVTDEEGNTYTQKQEVSFLTYAQSLIADESQPDEVKALAVAALNYANEAHKLLEGESVAEADALLSENEAPEAVAGPVYETAALSTVIRSAAMKLNANPEFVFKVARGFKGTISFTYTSTENGVVTVEKDVDATVSEQIVILDGFVVCDIFADITITAVSETAVATGTYNLSTYANGLDNPAFANALLAYAQASKAYVENQG